MVSWPQILWRHFTLYIRHDKITKYSSRCPELRRQNLVTLRSPHSTPQQLLLSSILADHGNRSGILDLLTVPYANHLHLAPNNCVSSSIFTDWVHFGAVVTVQSSEPTTNVPTQLNFLTPKCQRTEGNQACITTHTHLTALFFGTTRVGRYQKGKTNLDFTEARDSQWHWHQLGHMQVCNSLQTDNHASTPPLRFLQAGCPSCRPTNSVKALTANRHVLQYHRNRYKDSLVCGSCQEGHSWVLVVRCSPVVRDSRTPAITTTCTFTVCTPVSCTYTTYTENGITTANKPLYLPH